MRTRNDLPERLWESSVIKKRLLIEAAFECNSGISVKKHYWVLVPQADTRHGCIVLKNFEPNLSNAEPHEMQQEFARKLQETLQREAHFDGLWLVGFTHPPTTYGVITDTANCWDRLIMIWHDKDGDPQYTLESDRPFVSMIQDGESYWVEQAHTAHKTFLPMYGEKALKTDMGLKDEQTTKAALGALN